jgi:hypothetical protein
MSIAPQSISTNLRKMSDQQLAQYAKMHANDPYIFPLAFQESQDRKSMRAEAMAKQSGQAQPPVVQQDLAQMMPQQAPQQVGGQQSPQQVAQLPEDQGIGALPAQNMQSLAGGGITGEQHYADKGLVEPSYGYKAYTEADIPSKISPEDVVAYSQTLQSAAESMAAPEQAKTNALFDPYIEKLKGKQADIDERKGSNTNMAMLQAGLAMMGGTSPYGLANIAKGGQEGVSAYLAGKKSIQESQDLLDHSQFLAAQSKNSALKGDVRDAQSLQNAAFTQASNAQHLRITGLQLLNLSRAEQAKLAFEQEGNKIKQFEADTKAPYYKSVVALNNARAANLPDKEDSETQKNMHFAELEAESANSALKKAQAAYPPGSEMFDKYDAMIHRNRVAAYAKYKLSVPTAPVPTFDASQNQDDGWHLPSWLGGPSSPAATKPLITSQSPDGAPVPPALKTTPGVKFLGFEQ